MGEQGVGVSRRVALTGLVLAGGPAVFPRSVAGDGGDVGFVEEALRMRDVAVSRGDPAYGAVVVRGGAVVGRGASAVVSAGDPTAHAEMLAIRDACARLGTRDLSDCVLYGSAKACPMCETAAYWARIPALFFGERAEAAGAPGYPRC